MKIFIHCKKPEISKQSIEPVLFELKTKPGSVAELIGLIVEKIVDEYNSKSKNQPEDSSVFVTPKEEYEIQDLSSTGRIAFGLIFNEKKVSIEQAVKTALSGYEDGLFKIFLNHKLLGVADSKISVDEGDLLTIVRLTFLSGRII